MDPEEKRLAKMWERRKYIFVLQYVSCNIILSYLIIKISDYPIVRNYVILITMCLVVFLLIFRLIPAGLYLLSYNLGKMCGAKIPTRKINDNRLEG